MKNHHWSLEFEGGRYSGYSNAQRRSQARFKWEMSGNTIGVEIADIDIDLLGGRICHEMEIVPGKNYQVYHSDALGTMSSGLSWKIRMK